MFDFGAVRSALSKGESFHLRPVTTGYNGYKRYLYLTRGTEGKTYEIRMVEGRHTEVALLQHGRCLHYHYNAGAVTGLNEDIWIGPIDMEDRSEPGHDLPEGGLR